VARQERNHLGGSVTCYAKMEELYRSPLRGADRCTRRTHGANGELWNSVIEKISPSEALGQGLTYLVDA